MTAWSKKQFAKVKPRIKLKVREVPLEKLEELKKAEEYEFKQEVEELHVDIAGVKGKNS